MDNFTTTTILYDDREEPGVDDYDDTTDNTTDDILHWNDTKLMIVAFTPRITSAISIICSCILAKRTYMNRRKNIYHRLNLAMSIHLIIYGIWKIYGNFASPPPIFVVETTSLSTSTSESRSTSTSTSTSAANIGHVWGAGMGTTVTCSLQGFFAQLGYSISFYYVILSVYSFVAVKCNFHMQKYMWIEKWLHFAAHVFPVGSSMYLLSIQAFNDTGSGTCWIASIPFGCGGTDILVGGSTASIECVRGPQNIERIIWLFAGIPTFFVLLFPTMMMLVLYIEVRRKQHSIKLQASSVAKQASLYLAALYWCYLFTVINTGVLRIANKQTFGLQFLSGLTLNLQGVWFLLIYNHFHMKKKHKPKNATDRTRDDAYNNFDQSRNTTKEGNPDATASGTKSGREEQNHQRRSDESIVTTVDDIDSSGERDTRDGSGLAVGGGEAGGCGNIRRDTATTETDNTSFAFNIFDGTNASSSGAFAEYIFEGDSEDEREDQKQSKMWDTIQNHV